MVPVLLLVFVFMYEFVIPCVWVKRTLVIMGNLLHSQPATSCTYISSLVSVKCSIPLLTFLFRKRAHTVQTSSSNILGLH